MRVLFAGAAARGEGSTSLRAQGLTEALRIAGIEVVGLSQPRDVRDARSTLSKVRRRYLYDSSFAREIERCRPDAVLMHPGLGPSRAASRAVSQSRTAIVAAIADWYDWRHVPVSSTPQWMINEIAMRQARSRVHGCVVTSTYLASYFAAHGRSTVVVPALFAEVPRGEESRSEDEIIRVAYVGELAAKDALAVRHLVLALAQLDPAGRRLQGHIVGADRSVVESMVPEVRSLPDSVVVHGRVPRQQALNVLAAADYSIAQRDPQARYSKAGFPSKVAESLLIGTPVMSNVTSDLDRYLRDGRNAIVLDGSDLRSVVRGLERIQTSGVRWSSERISADGQDAFLPAAHAAALGDFFDKVVSRRQAREVG